MKRRPEGPAPWLLLPGILLTLGGVSLLSPHQAAQAAPVTLPAPAAAYDDGDGDELLEHWDSPKYSSEARVQIGGAAAGFLLLGIVVWRKRSARPAARLTLVDVSTPIQSSEQTRTEGIKAA